MNSDSTAVRRVPAEATRPLRQRLLRPNDTLNELCASDGSNTEAGYYAAVDNDSKILAVASARPEAPPWPSDATRPWRVRGVVTDEQYRNQGLGTAVMRAVLHHIRIKGGDLAWLNGRTPARSFYEHLEFRQIGDEWHDPESGPHMSMALKLTLQDYQGYLGR